jgi:hypothetical protein
MGPEITFLSEITTTKATSHQLFLVQSFIRPMVLVMCPNSIIILCVFPC